METARVSLRRSYTIQKKLQVVAVYEVNANNVSWCRSKNNNKMVQLKISTDIILAETTETPKLIQHIRKLNHHTTTTMRPLPPSLTRRSMTKKLDVKMKLLFLLYSRKYCLFLFVLLPCLTAGSLPYRCFFVLPLVLFVYFSFFQIS